MHLHFAHGQRKTPELVSSPSFDWEVAGEMVWGEAVQFSWTPTVAHKVLWTLYPSQRTNDLGSVTCMADASTGELTVDWDTMVVDVDPDQVTSIIAKLSLIEEDRVWLAHDNSEFWTLGQLTYWLYIDLIDP